MGPPPFTHSLLTYAGALCWSLVQYGAPIAWLCKRKRWTSWLWWKLSKWVYAKWNSRAISRTVWLWPKFHRCCFDQCWGKDFSQGVVIAVSCKPSAAFTSSHFPPLHWATFLLINPSLQTNQVFIHFIQVHLPEAETSFTPFIVPAWWD